MVNIWVVETLKHIGSKLLKLFHRKVESLHQLVILNLLDVWTDNLVVQCVAHDVDAGEVCHRRENCVRAIEESDLTLVVRSFRLSDEYVETGLVSRELGTELLACHVLRTLDNPEVENLCLYDEVILVANLVLDFYDVLAWEARNDAVNECRAYIVVFLKPLFEAFIVSAEIFLPQLDVLADAVLKVVAVEEDELTRHDDESLCWVALECLVTAVEELDELARVR